MKTRSKRGQVQIEMRKKRNIKTAGVEDHFQCLPDELLLCIFSSLSDIKSQCQCSLVCKRFASVISQIRSVSVTLQKSGARSIQTYKDTRNIFREIRSVDNDETSAFVKLLSLHEVKLPLFLRKFKDLESVYAEYTCPRYAGNPSSLKWKVKCRSDSILIETLVALLPASMCRKNESEEPDLEQLVSLAFIKSQIKNCLWLSYGRYVEWLSLTALLFKSHSSLRSVIITDSEKQGKLVVRNEQIVGMMHEKESDADQKLDTVLKIAWVPELHLPSSGYLMRDVCLAIIEFPTESSRAACKTNGADHLVSWEFEEEESVLGEAIREILKNHRNKIVVSN